MRHTKVVRLLAAAGVAAGSCGTASADLDFSWSGFVRSETAIKSNDTENPYNQRGNVFNGVTVSRHGDPKLAPIDDKVTRDGVPAHNTINMQLFRAELDSTFKITSSLSLQAKLRGIYDPDVYDNFNPASVNSQVQSTSAGNPENLYGRPNLFKYGVDGKPYPQPLEWAGKNYQVYFPALFLDYNQGPLDLRVGMQQIAWGQAIFFRVLDVVDGLDLRRHSALDFGSEEFSDKRVPAPAVRLDYQITDNVLADAFVQKFQPTVYSNPNSPYNVIASQFTIHDLYSNYDNRVDYGIRFKGELGDVGLQAIAVHRYNPDGVFRWTTSHVNRDLGLAPGSGVVMQNTAFEVDPTGVQSANEWFTYAGKARLNGVTGLNSSINEFPAAALLGAFPVNSTNCAARADLPVGNKADDPNSRDAYMCAAEELNSFFQFSGSGLRGHLAREYMQQDDFGGGASYVVSSTPGSLLDQLIINLETTYTPNRTFTNQSLSKDYIRKHEWTSALVMEKYQRFSADFPATYMVFQWMHKSESDLFGRYVGGMGGNESKVAPGYGGGWNAAVFAFQQPFPNLVWRFDFAALYDPKGGLLVQPAVRWKPNGQFTVEAFYNYLNGHLSNANDNVIGTIDFADEFTLRVGYQF